MSLKIKDFCLLETIKFTVFGLKNFSIDLHSSYLIEAPINMQNELIV